MGGIRPCILVMGGLDLAIVKFCVTERKLDCVNNSGMCQAFLILK